MKDARTIPLVAGPVLDNNGEVVPDGTTVSFTLTRDGGATTTASAPTKDGFAGAQLALSGPGSYSASAGAGSATSSPLTVTVLAIDHAPAHHPAPARRHLRRRAAAPACPPSSSSSRCCSPSGSPRQAWLDRRTRIVGRRRARSIIAAADASRITAAIDDALASESYRRGAEAIAADMAATPTVDEVFATQLAR